MRTKLSSESEFGHVSAVALAASTGSVGFVDRWRLAVDRRPVALAVRRWAALVGLGLVYAIGALLPFWYLTSPEAGAAFFPAAGLTLAALALSPRRTWPLWLAAVAIAEATVDLTHGQTVALAAGFTLANVLEPLVGASLLLWAITGREHNLRRTLTGYVTSAVVVGPLVGALVGAATALLLAKQSGSSSFFLVFGKWWLGDALGVLVVASVIVSWARPSRVESRAPIPARVTIVAVATALMVFPALLWQHPVVYAVLPVLIWAAFVGGTQAVTLAGVGVAFAADWAAITGRADRLLAPSPAGVQLVFVQIFLAVTLLTGMTLAVEVAERRRGEHNARKADAERASAERTMVEVAAAERRSLARDAHDIVGHGLNVMLLQAGAVRRVLDSDPVVAKDLLSSLETVGRRACRDLDVALAATSPTAEVVASGRGLSSLPALVAAMRMTGMRVELDMDSALVAADDRRDISTLVDWSAYRIVQEALTNVTKHAPDAAVQVTVRADADNLYVRVVDDGHDSASSNGRDSGRGVIGMRERVTALSGSIEVGPDGHHGFAVRARLPLRQALT